jgi:hypothetical protein
MNDQLPPLLKNNQETTKRNGEQFLSLPYLTWIFGFVADQKPLPFLLGSVEISNA